MSLRFEPDVQRIKTKILELARDEHIDSGVLVAALSDVLGIVAAQLDTIGTPRGLEDRMQSVQERAAQSYGRMRRLAG